MNKTALVCGAAGFLGSRIALAFANKGWRVVGAGRSAHHVSHSQISYVQGDLASFSFTNELLGTTKPNRIVFVAGPADVQQSFVEPAVDFAAHTMPLVQVLDRARKLEIQPGVVLVSSAAVYGNPAHNPVSERALPAPISPYGFHKWQQELLLDEFHKLYQLPTCSARIFSTYGEGLRHLAVWDITRRALSGDFSVLGPRQASRDYLHVSDVARAIEHVCVTSSFSGDVINVGSGTETTLESVATEIFGNLNIVQSPTFSGNVLEGAPIRWCADQRRLHSLGFRPSLSFKDGIRQTVDWIRVNG